MVNLNYTRVHTKTVRKALRNQSRICSKVAGLGIFPSDSLQSQTYEFIEITPLGPYYGADYSRNSAKVRCRCFEGCT